tara:strand:+ start:5386 stop:5883 length:498 start_codon:yes stop_codon:yes gene_type:complete
MATPSLKDIFHHYAGLSGPDEILPLMAEFKKLNASDQHVFARQVEDIFTEEVENGPYTEDDLEQLEREVAEADHKPKSDEEADNLNTEAKSLCLTFTLLNALSETPGYESKPLIKYVLGAFETTASEQRKDLLTLSRILAGARQTFFETHTPVTKAAISRPQLQK